MSSVNALLNERLKKKQQPSTKMTELARQTANGQLTSFSGVFSISELSEKEKQTVEHILKSHLNDDCHLQADLDRLLSITSEVKAITNQAAILHGERIKKAQLILTRYRDGAFSAWLMATYGNRQTPYNFLQYFEFYEALPKQLRPQIEAMPRQAVYTLASRQAPLDKKQLFVESYQGETKAELLTKIRSEFPLALHDKRREDNVYNLVQGLKKIQERLIASPLQVTKKQKRAINAILKDIHTLIQVENYSLSH